MRNPVADGEDVLDLGEASEGGAAGGLASAAHVEGDRRVALLGEAGGDASEEALESPEDGVGVDQHDGHVPRRIRRRLEEPRPEIHAVACLHRQRLHSTPGPSERSGGRGELDYRTE